MFETKLRWPIVIESIGNVVRWGKKNLFAIIFQFYYPRISRQRVYEDNPYCIIILITGLNYWA